MNTFDFMIYEQVIKHPDDEWETRRKQNKVRHQPNPANLFRLIKTLVMLIFVKNV